MQDTDATTITSRRANSALVAECRRRSISSLMEESFSMYRSWAGTVVVVVRHEVLDRVLREELPELVAELGGERLVVGDHERGPLDLLDRERHRGRLARARDAEERLEAVPAVDSARQRRQRLGLVGDRVVRRVDLELRHDL
jgi:hypothetical protein